MLKIKAFLSNENLPEVNTGSSSNRGKNYSRYIDIKTKS